MDWKLFGKHRARIGLANLMLDRPYAPYRANNVRGKLLVKDRVVKVAVDIGFSSLLSCGVLGELLRIDRIRVSFDDLAFLVLGHQGGKQGKVDEAENEKMFHRPRKSLCAIWRAIRSEVKFLACGEGSEPACSCEALVQAARTTNVMTVLRMSPNHQGAPIRPKPPQSMKKQ